MRPRALVVHETVPPGADPDALDVLVQADAVSMALDALGYRATRLTVSGTAAAVAETLQRKPADIVFNLVESLNGDGRLLHLVPLMLETAGARFTGCGSTALLTTSIKPLAKTIMSGSDIPTPPWLDQAAVERAEERGPWIVKSVCEHASIGIDATSVVEDTVAARAVMADRRRRLGGEWFTERFVDGREFNISVLDGSDGPEVLAVAEMCFEDFGPDEPRIVDYAAKWDVDSAAYGRTRPSIERGHSDGPLYDRLERLALRCWDVFGLKGYARVDVRVDDSDRPYVLEVNANPCLAPDAGFVLAAAYRGMDYRTLISRIVESAPVLATTPRVAA